MSHMQKPVLVNCELINRMHSDLPHAFDWSDTIDGGAFWQGVFNRLSNLKQHGTSDYQPVQPKQPEITDEWLIRFIRNHGRRPFVQVRDYAVDEWSLPRQLVVIGHDVPFKYRTLQGGVYRFCKLADGEPLE